MLKLFLPRDSVARAVGAEQVAAALAHEAGRRQLPLELRRTSSRGLYWLEPLLEVEDAAGRRLGFGPLAEQDVPALLDALAADATIHPLALQLPSVLPSELLGRRPDVVAARWRVEAADKQIKVAKTRFYPSLNLTALGGVVSKNLDSLLQSGSTFGLLAPALSLPIFDGGRLRAGLAGSAASQNS